MEKDENFRMVPENKYFVKSKGQVKQNRVLCDG